MERRVPDNNIRRVMDQALPGLEQDLWFEERVMQRIKETEGEPVKMKKKISVGLAVALALMLMSVTAFAATLVWQQYAEQLAEKEHAQGHYATWAADERVALVQSLVTMGYLDEAEENARMLAEDTPAEERQTLADAMLLSLIGEDNVDEICLETITYAIMGYEDFWTPEQRVWWQKILNMYRTADANDIYVVPQDGDLSEAEAVAIAKAAILEAYELPEDALNSAQSVANLYVTKQHPDDRRWEVAFKLYQEGTEHYEVRRYTAIVNAAGEIIGDPDIPVEDIFTQAERSKAAKAAETELDMLPTTAIFMKYLNTFEYYRGFDEWPAEMKAAYSAEIQPIIAGEKDTEAFRIQNIDEVFYSTRFIYGMPGDGELSESAALEMAKQAVLEQCGISAEDFARYTRMMSAYDVTDSTKPLWKFSFWNPDDPMGIWYRAMIHGQTGEVVFAEAFPCQGRKAVMSEEDIEFQLKYFY